MLSITSTQYIPRNIAFTDIGTVVGYLERPPVNVTT